MMIHENTIVATGRSQPVKPNFPGRTENSVKSIKQQTIMKKARHAQKAGRELMPPTFLYTGRLLKTNIAIAAPKATPPNKNPN